MASMLATIGCKLGTDKPRHNSALPSNYSARCAQARCGPQHFVPVHSSLQASLTLGLALPALRADGRRHWLVLLTVRTAMLGRQ